MTFSKNTFKYLDLAQKNRRNKAWFDKNKDLYENSVKLPIVALLKEIEKKYKTRLPQIDIGADKITRPLRAKNKAAEQGFIKAQSYFTLAEKKTSLFEWNPGIYFQVGADKDDNFFGLGLYIFAGEDLPEVDVFDLLTHMEALETAKDGDALKAAYLNAKELATRSKDSHALNLLGKKATELAANKFGIVKVGK